MRRTLRKRLEKKGTYLAQYVLEPWALICFETFAWFSKVMFLGSLLICLKGIARLALWQYRLLLLSVSGQSQKTNIRAEE